MFMLVVAKKYAVIRGSLFIFVLVCLLMPVIGHTEPTGRIFITNEKDNSVSVINGKTLEVEHEIAIGKRPRGISMSSDGTEVYVAVSEENAIAIFDPVTLKILRKFQSGSDPETFAVHPNGHLYISNEDDAKATVYNPKTGDLITEIPVGLEPEGVAISPDGKKVIVTSESSNMLHVINTSDNKVVANILVGARPRAAVFALDNSTAYATAEITGEIIKVDITNAKILKRAQLQDSKNSKPKDVILSKDQQYLYVAGGRSNTVWLLNANTLETLKGIPVGNRVWGLAMTKDGNRVFSSNGVSHTVSVIDTVSNEVIKTITVGKFPWGIAIDD